MSILNEQKLRRKPRSKKAATPNGRFSSTIENLLSTLSFWLSRAMRLALSSPKKVLAVAGMVSALACGWGLYRAVATFQNNLLPKSLTVQAASPIMTAQITTLAEVRLREARDKKMTRSQLLQNLTSDLALLDAVDEFWVRSGLDGHLQIMVTLQIPIAEIESANNTRFLVGSNMRIYAKNPTNSKGAGLLRIQLPETTIYWQPRSSNKERSSYHKELPLNLPWMIRQTRTIRNGAEPIRELGFSFEKVVFRNHSGFNLLLRRDSKSIVTSSAPPTVGLVGPIKPVEPVRSEMLVTLGDTELAGKLKKLKQVLEDLSNRQLNPASIDLNFQDKALIRLAENQPPIAL